MNIEEKETALERVAKSKYDIGHIRRSLLQLRYYGLTPEQEDCRDYAVNLLEDTVRCLDLLKSRINI